MTKEDLKSTIESIIFNDAGNLTERIMKEIDTYASQEKEKGAVEFAEWSYLNAKVYPDGWHYKGDAMTTKQLYELYKEKTK